MTEKADDRIPITSRTKGELKDFKDGLGTDYDRAIRVLFQLALDQQKDRHSAGRELRDKLGILLSGQPRS